MCQWESELRQAFQEAIIRGQPFTVLDIRDRVRSLTHDDNIDYKSIKYELLTLLERSRPDGWVLTTIPVVDAQDVPRNVWQVSPLSLLQPRSVVATSPIANPSNSGWLGRWTGFFR